MNNGVIFTKENYCRDCYKCVRHCPVEAINMVDHHASIDCNSCIACGKCIEVCPASAQQYRNDEKRVLQLLNSNKKVILSIAPSFISEIDLDPKVIVSRAKQAGFWGVSETALGAQLVSYEQRHILSKNKTSEFSTACPSFVHLILKHRPDKKKYLSSLLSPLLSHCKMLRKLYGNDIAIVFAGPCLSKKLEADHYPDLLDVALTFEEFKNFLENKESDEKIKDTSFIPCQSGSGSIYPIDGGMNETINKLTPFSVINTSFFNFSGTKEIMNIIDNEEFDNHKVFCEFLACKGGCINGPATTDHTHIISKKEKISKYYNSLPKHSENDFIKKYNVDITTKYDFIVPEIKIKYYKNDLKPIYIKLNKTKKEDFIDCGGCGYDTCEKFAIACLDNKAEISMCTSSMRQKALNKIKSLMLVIPIGICIIDKSMKIVECNKTFLKSSVDVDIEITEELTKRVIGINIEKYFKVSEPLALRYKSNSVSWL